MARQRQVIHFSNALEIASDLVLGPFNEVHLNYTRLEVVPAGVAMTAMHDHVAFCNASGLWEIQLTGKMLKEYGTQHNGKQFTDVQIECADDTDVRTFGEA